MENETMQVERLNRGRPPPGYILEVIDNEWWWGEGQGWLDVTSYLDHDAALKAAWAHHEARHDCPRDARTEDADG